MGISLIIFVILIRFAGKHVAKDIKPVEVSGNYITNYYPLVFHLTIIALLIFSCFNPIFLTGTKIHVLVNDGFFQFYICILILIISYINPFLPISEEHIIKIEQAKLSGQNNWLNWFLIGKNWQLIKLFLCLIVVWIFIHEKYLVIPSLNQGIVSDVYIALTVIYIFGCIIKLIKDPQLFKKQTIFRLSMLYRSFKTSFFISIGLILFVFITTTTLNLKIKDLINYEGIALLVYNTVMAYNEYKIIKA